MYDRYYLNHYLSHKLSINFISYTLSIMWLYFVHVAVKLAQRIQISPLMPEVVTPVSTNALVNIECSWNSLHMELTTKYFIATRTKLRELILAAMISMWTD